MWNAPSDEALSRLPVLYSTESVPLEDKIIYEHFFLGSCDWYMAEYGLQDRIFFGYAKLLPGMGEWGYTSLDELLSLSARGLQVDRDRYWQPKRFGEIADLS